MTFDQYNNLSVAERNKLDNRIRQWAHRCKKYLPSKHVLFVLLMAHLLRNAHTYFDLDQPSDIQCKVLESKCISDETKEKIVSEYKCANKKVREIKDMKGHNRVQEQKEKVIALKEQYGTVKNIANISGIPRNTVMKWCTSPKQSIKRRVELSQLRRDEYEQFLLQDNISFEHPCKKYAGRRYLRNTIKEIRKIYLDQPQYHKYGILSETRMKDFKPAYIKLCSRTPMESCLCEDCENCKKIIKALLAIGLKCIPSNRFQGIRAIMCPDRYLQIGTTYKFPRMECMNGTCNDCGIKTLYEDILKENKDIINQHKTVTWKKWATLPGRKSPDIVHVRGMIIQAVEYLTAVLKNMTLHIFRSNWNRNWFDYIRDNLIVGLLAQIFDFSMNFRNTYQDEVQSAFFEATQTSIHVIINSFLCLTEGCSKVVTLVVCQISDDLHHDSFFARAAHDQTFRYLASLGIPLETIVQFSDNCAAQYKSRRPFAEIARSPLNIVRVYFGERHGKNQCDGFFGRLKKFVTDSIKTRTAEIRNAREFFRFCKEKYEKAPQPGQCHHYRVVFQFLEQHHMRRHHDCDLEKAVEGTRSAYSVRNTLDPLRIKMRKVRAYALPV